MKIDYMEPFVKAACAVLERISGNEVVANSISLLGTTCPTGAVNLGSRISGSLEGRVVYDMSGETSQRLSGLITGIETHGFGRIMGNGLTELGRMLAEQTRRQLADDNLDCEIEDPLVFRGLNVEFYASVPALSVKVDTDAGPVNVNVAVKNGKQT